MGVISLLWGLVSVCWMLLAFIPLLGWGNWFMIPWAGVGILFGAVVVAAKAPQNRGAAKVGLLLNVLAVGFGIVRLMLGGGLI